jgi:hypothetical protein
MVMLRLRRGKALASRDLPGKFLTKLNVLSGVPILTTQPSLTHTEALKYGYYLSSGVGPASVSNRQ